ncbi:ankyrin repeat domain-containing protein 1-like [Seriola dumerili]|uniref:ankyrin repeat domain-containing protein 1-like n=1 Tax=Seriola dumerili TaxID=41447 RepID=UPI000BBEF322|nr:ankyrin repeat domain-containing protein 1-like [Seriola dumerili]
MELQSGVVQWSPHSKKVLGLNLSCGLYIFSVSVWVPSTVRTCGDSKFTQVEDGGYESSVSEEKQDTQTCSRNPDSEPPGNLKTDKSGRLLLETPADLQNLLLLRKTKKQQKASVTRPAAASPAVRTVPYYVDEEDFFKACDQAQELVIEKYLSTGGDINACDTFERTGLHRACSQGHIDVISKLLESGANINSRDKLWSTCVHSACRGGHLSVLKKLLNNGANMTAKDKLDSTPLHVSVRTGHHDCAEHLIQCGADLNTQDREGDTPLHDAVRLNRFKIIQLLLLHGADTHITNQDGQCPLDRVLQWQNEAKTLLMEQHHRK